MTYSVVARDPVTSRLGVAVHSCVFAVGTRVPAARPGVAAVAVQAGSPLWHRQLTLDLVGRGLSADEALAAVLALPGADERQLAVVDANGRVGVHTGGRCAAAAGHTAGSQVSAQANLVERPGVWEAMLAAYAATDGPLEDRLLAALAAAEAEGGDLRGRQSAALLVVGPVRGEERRGDDTDPVTDLRVDDHQDPIGELRRLLTVKRAHDHLMRGLRTSGGRAAGAADELLSGYALAPADGLVAFWAGLALALEDRLDEARPLLEQAARDNPRWSALLRQRAATDPALGGQPGLAEALGILETEG